MSDTLPVVNTRAEVNLIGTLCDAPAEQARWLTRLPAGALTDPPCVALAGIMRAEIAATGNGISQYLILDRLVDKQYERIEDAMFSVMRRGGLPFELPRYFEDVMIAYAARLRQAQVQESAQRIETPNDVIDEIAGASSELSKVQDILNAAGNLSEQLEEQEIAESVVTENAEQAQAMGISSGIPALDAVTRGFRRGEVIIIAGRPGCGKSALALQTVFDAAKEGIASAFYSLEMARRDVRRRLVRSEFPLGIDKEARAVAVEFFKTLPLHLADAAKMDCPRIVADIESRVATAKLRLACIDYLQIVRPPPMNKGANREAEVAAMSKAFQQLAAKCDIPVIVLAQLNRQATQGTPHLSHLRESGAIEQDASVVILIDLEIDGGGSEDAAREMAERLRRGDGIPCRLRVEKNRNGPTGVAEVLFYPAEGRFEGRRAAENAEPKCPQPPADRDRAWYAKED